MKNSRLHKNLLHVINVQIGILLCSLEELKADWMH